MTGATLLNFNMCIINVENVGVAGRGWLRACLTDLKSLEYGANVWYALQVTDWNCSSARPLIVC